MLPIVENIAKTDRHRTFYLACGAEDAPLIVFVHGWPELSISWRHQLPCFGALGFRAIAPDMRGYGRSSVYPRHEDYALEHIVEDMIELLDSLGRDQAIWVGHDWGSPVVWSLASHHPERCSGVANLCVPYFAKGFAPDVLVPLVDRSVYPESAISSRPVGVSALLRGELRHGARGIRGEHQEHRQGPVQKGQPQWQGQAVAHRARASRRRLVRRGRPGARRADGHGRADGGGFPQVRGRARGNGFFGPDSWYMNPPQPRVRDQGANGGELRMPVLFLHGEYDYTCETITPVWPSPCGRMPEPDRGDRGVRALDGAGEARAVNAALAKWLAAHFPDLWPV